MWKRWWWIVLIITLIAGELIFRGAMTWRDDLLALWGVNAALALLLLLCRKRKVVMKRCNISPYDIYRIKRNMNWLIEHYLIAILITRWAWECLQLIAGYGWSLWFVWLSVIIAYMSIIYTTSLWRGSVYWGKELIPAWFRGILMSIYIVMLTLQIWRYDTDSLVMIYALGAGWLFYTVFVQISKKNKHTVFQDVAWCLYGIAIGMMLVWVWVGRLLIRFDDHTIEKVVFKEKEKVVYISENILRDTLEDPKVEEIKNQDEVKLVREEKKEKPSRQEQGKKNIEKKMISLKMYLWWIDKTNCDEDTCFRSGECISLPEQARCRTPLDDTPRSCSEWYEERDGTCKAVCKTNECLYSIENFCVTKPLHASCVEDHADYAWLCHADYYKSGEYCFLKISSANWDGSSLSEGTTNLPNEIKSDTLPTLGIPDTSRVQEYIDWS